MMLRTADVITPANRPRMNGMAVPSGTRRIGRKEGSFQEEFGSISEPLPAINRGCRCAQSDPRPGLDLEDQVRQEEEKQRGRLEPAARVLPAPGMALVAPRDGLDANQMPFTPPRLSDIACVFE